MHSFIGAKKESGLGALIDGGLTFGMVERRRKKWIFWWGRKEQLSDFQSFLVPRWKGNIRDQGTHSTGEG